LCARPPEGGRPRAAGGEGLLSCLLFDTGICSALIELGYRDAQAKRAELAQLLAIS
jgi:NTE family protein